MTIIGAENGKKKNDTEDEISQGKHATSYLETLMHLFKGNVGAGLFAMGDAFKNGGLMVAPFLTVIIAVICVHCEHVLVNSSRKAKKVTNCPEFLDYAETVEKCFEIGPKKLRSWSNTMRTIIQVFICVTQLGFCCIYFVFITENIEQILNYHGVMWDTKLIMTIMLVPILIPSLLTNLKYLAPISMLANLLLSLGLVITLYYAFEGGLPSASERNYTTTGSQMALYFGTVLFSFEGIALVLPLRNSMKKPKKFSTLFGVLNVGMSVVTFLFIFTGFFGYLKWGEEVGGSLTLNLDVTKGLAQAVKIMASLGVFFGYPLQFFVPINIMWPSIKASSNCLKNNPLIGEAIFRTLMVLLTFSIALLVPKLSLFISLIGAFCSTALALLFPSLIELIVKSDNAKGPGTKIFVKNIFIILFGLLGTVMGTYQSISDIVKEFSS